MATAESRAQRVPSWLAALGPVLLIALATVVIIATDPLSGLGAAPPEEALAVERTVIEPGSFVLQVRNDGADPVSIAQILVNDAYRPFEIGDARLGRLESTTIRVPYPWEEGLPYAIAVLTSTGVRIEHEIEAAALTPASDAGTFGVYALLGLYVGVIPVILGLLWYPALRAARPRWISFFLAFTVGLLVFLLVDTTVEGLEIASEVGAALDGVALFAVGAVAAVLALVGAGHWLEGRRSGVRGGLVLAYLVAVGIGLHNLGEGLAVAAAVAAGEVALGTFLVVGFALHNTTEGLAIVAPLGDGRRPALAHFAAFGLVAGAPTILGAWIGGFAFNPAWGALFFGIAAGAIAQVVWAVGRALPKDHPLSSPLTAFGLVAGLVVMYSTALLTA